jgi:hypothetical protein
MQRRLEAVHVSQHESAAESVIWVILVQIRTCWKLKKPIRMIKFQLISALFALGNTTAFGCSKHTAHNHTAGV